MAVGLFVWIVSVELELQVRWGHLLSEPGHHRPSPTGARVWDGAEVVPWGCFVGTLRMLGS